MSPSAERSRRLFELALQEPPDPVLLAAERRRTREPGLLALARQNRDRRYRLFAQLDTGRLGGRAEGFLAEVHGLAGAMEEEGGEETNTALQRL